MTDAAVSAPPRGYFAIGAERISKALNLGNLMRSAHGFGASFTFTIGATYQALEARADTSKGAQHLPHYDWPSAREMALPAGCKLVGVELLEEAIDLPSFHHPQRAAYVLGPERGSLSPELLERCDYLACRPASASTSRWREPSSCTTGCARWAGSRRARRARAECRLALCAGCARRSGAGSSSVQDCDRLRQPASRSAPLRSCT